jgi:PAS domain S-box-containing protein
MLGKTTEWTFVRKSGRKVAVKISLTSLMGADGTIRGTLGLLSDVSREKEYLESLRESEAINRAIINAVPDLMFRIHRDGTYLDSHSQSSSALYVPKELFIGKKIMDILPADQARHAMQAIERAFATGQVEQYEYMLPGQDKERYFENRIVAISDEQVLSIIRDITHRKESEIALKMQSAAFESFALPIIITDSDGRIQWVNPAYTELTGYSVAEAMEKTPGELSKSGRQDDDFYTTFWNLIKGGKVWSGELQNRRKDGSIYPEEMTVTPVLDHQDRVSGFIAIKIDITERKKMEQSLLDTIEREKELGELKSKFISIISHEFRTPLATIRASSDSLVNYWEQMTVEQRGIRLTKINDQVMLMAGYIDEMLLLSKFQKRDKTSEPEAFELVGLFREIVDELRALPGNRQRIEFTPMADRVEVRLYRLEVRAVFLNLLTNALKYSALAEKVMVSLSVSEKELELVVKDRGIGIPEGEISRLYEPFFRATNTSNIPGTGLGLSIVKESVERQNGKIAIESRLNHGTTVIVVLPRAINN